jgi:type IV pilus assembly protein PilA
MSPQYPPPQHPPPQRPPSKGFPTWLIVLIAIGGFVFFVLPIFSVLAIYGVRKYLANAKSAEARNALGQIAKDAATAYEKNGALCPSASRGVPANVAMIRAKNAGFACLQFALSEPQYFQYSYTASPNGTFAATAHGDLNGDGNLSTYVVRGEVKGGQLVIEPQIEETDPFE